MTATVRLDKGLEEKLEHIANTLHKKKSDIIRDAIAFYADSIESERKRRILNAIAKTQEADRSEIEAWDGVVDDGL